MGSIYPVLNTRWLLIHTSCHTKGCRPGCIGIPYLESLARLLLASGDKSGIPKEAFLSLSPPELRAAIRLQLVIACLGILADHLAIENGPPPPPGLNATSMPVWASQVKFIFLPLHTLLWAF